MCEPSTDFCPRTWGTVCMCRFHPKSLQNRRFPDVSKAFLRQQQNVNNSQIRSDSQTQSRSLAEQTPTIDLSDLVAAADEQDKELESRHSNQRTTENLENFHHFEKPHQPGSLNQSVVPSENSKSCLEADRAIKQNLATQASNQQFVKPLIDLEQKNDAIRASMAESNFERSQFSSVPLGGLNHQTQQTTQSRFFPRVETQASVAPSHDVDISTRGGVHGSEDTASPQTRTPLRERVKAQSAQKTNAISGNSERKVSSFGTSFVNTQQAGVFAEEASHQATRPNCFIHSTGQANQIRDSTDHSAGANINKKSQSAEPVISPPKASGVFADDSDDDDDCMIVEEAVSPNFKPDARAYSRPQQNNTAQKFDAKMPSPNNKGHANQERPSPSRRIPQSFQSGFQTENQAGRGAYGSAYNQSHYKSSRPVQNKFSNSHESQSRQSGASNQQYAKQNDQSWRNSNSSFHWTPQNNLQNTSQAKAQPMPHTQNTVEPEGRFSKHSFNSGKSSARDSKQSDSEFDIKENRQSGNGQNGDTDVHTGSAKNNISGSSHRSTQSEHMQASHFLLSKTVLKKLIPKCLILSYYYYSMFEHRNWSLWYLPCGLNNCYTAVLCIYSESECMPQSSLSLYSRKCWRRGKIMMCVASTSVCTQGLRAIQRLQLRK